MSDAARSMLERVQELRRGFDESFAAAPARHDGEREDLLLIGAGNEQYALRVADLSGVEARRKIVPLPLDRPGFLGLAGIQGRLTPVFSLSALLGQSPEPEMPWLAVCGRREPVALAFPRLHGHAAVQRHEKHPAPDGQELRPHVREAVRIAGRNVYVLEVSSIVEAILKRSGEEHAT